MSGPSVACFGEILLRYSPMGGRSLASSDAMEVHVGGAEANVAAALASLGHPARMVSTVPDNPVGDRALRELRAHGVDCASIVRNGGRMGAYFYDPPAGPVAAGVTYDREGSAFAMAGRRAYDMEATLDGAGHLHLSGINLAVSEESAEAAIALAELAGRKGIAISFDGNFRPALWARTSRRPRPLIGRLVSMADLFFGNHKDIALLLEAEFSGDGPERRREAALAALEAFPNLKAIASTARHVHDSSTHSITARIDTAESSAEAPERRLTGILDRIGTGDAFAAGVLHGWLTDSADLDLAVRSGSALAAIKHYRPGDITTVSRTELDLAMEGARDVRR
ncbi:sugar kinase [Paraurantiacibacter namhicola]|uniref:sugar kinase n=1 Tax=Paraurantiacibacter namhicola TaxID=645517 RepID=UPI000AB2EFD1|nr:sugar kinase [Paraurantiacibacter namhicola]